MGGSKINQIKFPWSSSPECEVPYKVSPLSIQGRKGAGTHRWAVGRVQGYGGQRRPPPAGLKPAPARTLRRLECIRGEDNEAPHGREL